MFVNYSHLNLVVIEYGNLHLIFVLKGLINSNNMKSPIKKWNLKEQLDVKMFGAMS